MTREEAIQVLKEISVTLKSWSGFTKYPQAIDMAIEALQREEAEARGYCHRIKPKEHLKNDAINRAEQKLREMPRYLNGVKAKQIKKISADDEPKWTCTANFVAEQLDKLEDMSVSEKLKLIQDLLGVEFKEENLNYKHATLVDIKEPLKVEVVRCKDCRHRDLFSCPLADNDFQKDEDFCSWGERREP